MNYDSAIRGKLGEAYAMSPWTEDKLDELLELLEAYGKQQYDAGYMAALEDAQSAARRATVGTL